MRRRGKIVATLGPVSDDLDTIRALHTAGASVFRLNYSHGDAADHARRARLVRQVEAESGRPIALLADLQGPKIRLGAIPDGPVDIRTGDSVVLAAHEGEGIHLPHPEVFAGASAGDTILIDDGRIELWIETADQTKIEASVVTGGTLRERKGVNVPFPVPDLSTLTDKDVTDLEHACELGVDWIALSFVQNAGDIEDLRERVGPGFGLCAKIEKPSALDNIDAIAATADAVMVARGDLGVEIGVAQVPGAQRTILDVCRRLGRPTIVATQALESMIESPVPTRAEISDIATAIRDGADAVMLSAETAAGKHPQRAVSIMAEIIAVTEADDRLWRDIGASDLAPERGDAAAIAGAACHIASQRGCGAIEILTESGATALRVARHRSRVPMIAVTPDVRTARRLALAWGVEAHVVDPRDMEAELDERGHRIARRVGVVDEGDRIVLTTGQVTGKPGGTDSLRIVMA